MNKRKLYGTLIAVILFAIIIAGATFAWFIYGLDVTNGVYNTATACFDTIGTEGQNLNTSLSFVARPVQGISTSFSMGLNSNCNISAEGVIYLNVANTTSSILYSNVLAHCENYNTLETLYEYDNVTDCSNHSGSWVTDGSALKYAIYTTSNPDANTIPIKTGYIKSTGDNMLYNAELQVGSATTYYIYIWLDGELTDENYTSDMNLSGYIHTKANQLLTNVVNPPELVDGLIPVKLSPTGDVVTSVSENDSTWYDYYKKEWANAVLVKEDTHTRTYYINNPGTTIPQEDILGYFVWIPRYSYKVWQYTGNSSSSLVQEISIKFIAPSVIEQAYKNGDWYTHPAFWWDSDSDGARESGEELSGMWVSKFKTSKTTSDMVTNNLGTDSTTNKCNQTGCNNSVNLRIIPNKTPVRANRIATEFYAVKFMESSGNPFGLNSSASDIHMMKNSEWGALAYLSHSKHGINTQMRLNDQSDYLTGCAAATNDSNTLTADCGIAYGTTTIYPQSTNGNVTGVFDMSGGAGTHVMAHWGTTQTYGTNTGFSSTYPLPDSKYYDNYSDTLFTGTATANFNFCTLDTCGGQALNETKGWYSDLAYLANSSSVWLMRGGTKGTTAGVFACYAHSGAAELTYTFRTTIIPK